MFPIEVFQKTVQKLVSILNELLVPYHIVGGLTSVAWAEPRMTQDVDLVVGSDALVAEAEKFLEALGASDFLYTPGEVRSAIRSGSLFQLMDSEECLKLDIYPKELIPGELQRSKQIEVFAAGEWLPVASREDTVVAKLIWISKGSHKSRRDVRVLYRNTDKAQQDFIAQMVEGFGLTALLAEVLAESDEIH